MTSCHPASDRKLPMLCLLLTPPEPSSCPLPCSTDPKLACRLLDSAAFSCHMSPPAPLLPPPCCTDPNLASAEGLTPLLAAVVSDQPAIVQASLTKLVSLEAGASMCSESATSLPPSR